MPLLEPAVIRDRDRLPEAILRPALGWLHGCERHGSPVPLAFIGLRTRTPPKGGVDRGSDPPSCLSARSWLQEPAVPAEPVGLRLLRRGVRRGRYFLNRRFKRHRPGQCLFQFGQAAMVVGKCLDPLHLTIDQLALSFN